MTETEREFPGCTSCRHLQLDATCPAFPDGIPLRVLSGEQSHLDELPGQVPGTVFEPYPEGQSFGERLIAAFGPKADSAPPIRKHRGGCRPTTRL
jgi:hypothetical protein